MSALAVSTASAMITFIFSGSAVILRLVEHDLELLAILVITLQHADFGDIREASARRQQALAMKFDGERDLATCTRGRYAHPSPCVAKPQ